MRSLIHEMPITDLDSRCKKSTQVTRGVKRRTYQHTMTCDLIVYDYCSVHTCGIFDL